MELGEGFSNTHIQSLIHRQLPVTSPFNLVKLASSIDLVAIAVHKKLASAIVGTLCTYTRKVDCYFHSDQSSDLCKYM